MNQGRPAQRLDDGVGVGIGHRRDLTQLAGQLAEELLGPGQPVGLVGVGCRVDAGVCRTVSLTVESVAAGSVVGPDAPDSVLSLHAAPIRAMTAMSTMVTTPVREQRYMDPPERAGEQHSARGEASGAHPDGPSGRLMVAMRVGVTLPLVTPAGEPVSIDIDQVAVAYDGPPVLRGVSLAVEPGELVALLGPSGCGKTTLLRAIAGLEAVDAGTIVLGGQVVSSPETHVAPERRRVGMVFQDWALFPHLSVARNVAYGLPRNERSGSRVNEVLDMVGLGGLGDRSPQTLSGGQQQRVALARALAPAPTVLLLDEPFSNLDATLRVQIRTEVHRLLSELDVTAVFVTHDQDEAFVLGHRVAVMRGGELEQWGTPAEVYARPATPWVAGFVGEANLLDGLVDRRSAATAIGVVPLLEAPSDQRVSVLVRPEELALGTGDGGVVELVEYYGHDTTYDVRLGDGQRVRVRRPSVPQFERGEAVAVHYQGAGAWTYRAAAFGDVRQA